MIKINLAKKKQAAFSVPEQSGAGTATAGGSFRKFTTDLDAFRELPIRTFAVGVVFAFAASWFADSLKQEKMQEAGKTLTALQETQTKLQTEAGKMKQYEALRKALEEDETTIRAKIEIIDSLIGDRKEPFLLLRSLANAIPTGVWLDEFKLQGKDAALKGEAVDLPMVSEFIKNLNESIHFGGSVSFKDIKPEGKFANFELTAKRR